MVSDEKYIDYLKSYYDKESDDKTKAKAVKSIMDLLKKGTMPQDGLLAYRLAKFIYLRDEIKNSKTNISVDETLLACKLFKIASKSGIDKATDILKEMEVRYRICDDSRAKRVLDELGITDAGTHEIPKKKNIAKLTGNEEKTQKAIKQSVVSTDETTELFNVEDALDNLPEELKIEKSIASTQNHDDSIILSTDIDSILNNTLTHFENKNVNITYINIHNNGNNNQSVIGSNNELKRTTNNIKISNIEKINFAFETLCSPNSTKESLAGAIKSLPTMTSYIDSENITEKVTNQAEQQLYDDYSKAPLDKFIENGEEWNVLKNKVKKETFDHFPYLDRLKFALKLHSVFKKIETKMQISDYCPIAIMYCKLVEDMLKEKHTDLYKTYLGEKTIGKGDVTFNKLTSSKKLSIGSFSYHLVYAEINLAETEKSEFKYDRSPKGDNYPEKNIEALCNGNYELKKEWKKHAENLAYIHEIRNKAVHEADPISKDVFDLLIEKLFSDGELLRICELSKR